MLDRFRQNSGTDNIVRWPDHDPLGGLELLTESEKRARHRSHLGGVLLDQLDGNDAFGDPFREIVDALQLLYQLHLHRVSG